MSKNLGNTLKSTNLKGKTFAIALILLLTMSSALAILPPSKAQTYSYTPTLGSNGLWNLPTFGFVTLAPDPVGVGQPVQVIMIIELLPPSTGTEGKTLVTGGWQGYVLTITDPNGTTTTLGPYLSDVSGTYQISYTPDTVGTYYFQFTFPGQTVNGTGYGTLYGNFMASTSSKVSLTVQQAPVTGYSEAPVPLPTQYWTRPIDLQNRYWNSISGPWLMSSYNATGMFNPYTYAPESAHILWTQSEYTATGGLTGGDYGSLGGVQNALISGMSTSPEGPFWATPTPIIMDGYIYYEGPYNVELNGTTTYYFYCANLQTGQVMWRQPVYGPYGSTITCGQILNWRSQQNKANIPYLWSIAAGSYSMYSGYNGALLAKWGNVPAGSNVARANYDIRTPTINLVPTITDHAISVLSGTVVLEPPHPTVIGQDIGGAGGGGALLVYIYGKNPGATTGYLECWNSTLAIESINNDPQAWPFGATGSAGGILSLTNTESGFPTIAQQLTTTPLDWEYGIMWNITVPLTSTTAATGGSAPATWSIAGADTTYVILQTAKSYPNITGTSFRTLAAIAVGNQPMTTTYTTDVGGDTQVPTQGTFAWIENYTVPAYDQENTVALRSDGNIIIIDGTLLEVYDYSESTGALLWSVAPFENAFATQSQNMGVAAYGMLYDPGYDGYMHAINMTTGIQMWETFSRMGGLEMPQPYYPMSGIIVGGGEVFTTTAKSYEAQPLYRGHCLYAYDATTGAQKWNISGQIFVGALADGVLLGTNAYDNKVYAFSRGPTTTSVTAPMTAVAAGSSMIIQGTVTDQTPTSQAKGTPAISDAWMTPWMEYLYMDQPLPHDATGVPVQIDAIDPNGNYIHLGNATSDITGAYSYQWTPPDIPGKYTIIATFSADNSYYGSSGETAAVVVPAATAVAPTATPTSVADMYFVPAIAGVIVAIIIGFVVLALLMLRKRP